MRGYVISPRLPPAVGTVGKARGEPSLSGFASSLKEALSAGSSGPPAVRAPAQARSRSSAFDELIREAARRERVDEQLVRAVVEAESGFRPEAVSPAGAMGLMQLMPGTARTLGVKDPFDPASNVAGGVRFLRAMLDRFGSVPLALAAYNAGPGAVEKFGGIPPYQETRTYVNRVLQLQRRDQLAAARPEEGGADGGVHTA